MLVLTRKLGEGIAIGDDIKIVVMQIKGKQVRLGIKANPTTVVHREEVFKKIQEENALASKVNRNLISEVAQAVKFSPSQQALGQSPLRTKRREKRS